MRTETLHRSHIYWVVDDDGNVLTDLREYEGDYEIGDQIVADGRPRRVVDKVTEEGHPEVIWVRTVAEAPSADWVRQRA
jgi:hypothetical protein